MQLSVVILAAGKGKRMNSDLPKVLQPLAGRPLLEHVVATAHSLEPAAIHVVYGYGGEQVQAALAGHALDWVAQCEQLGTGHALLQAMPRIPDEHRVLVLYGDVPLVTADTLRALLAAADGDAVAVLTTHAANPQGLGRILRDAAGGVAQIVEQADATAEQSRIREINTGIMSLPARAARQWLAELGNANAQREYYLTDIVAAAVRTGVPVRGVSCDDATETLGVNDKIQLARVEAVLRARRAQQLMLAGATLLDPNRIDLRGTVTVGRDVSIDINAVFIGRVTLGARVKIGPNCVIRDASIGADTEIHANSLVDQARVGERCIVGPFARIRPDCVLADAVHIGNFVEVKNSSLGKGSKANHLSYVGDTQIGSGVNVGAGSITCNYDGENKWPTVIEDGAFIGSGSMLVAPVRIGAGATIGAGSTITANVPEDTLSLARARQTTVDTWRRPAKLSPADKAAAVERALQPSAPPPSAPPKRGR
jgi:bifunctional UDP-N-acetylglucosamine pyrophosphorylase/glucosamine-1-phosphate N-acetyltransferase